MKKITKKLLASVLTFIIFFAELSTLGMYGIAYATEARDTATSNQNIEFDVYFANDKREVVSDVNTEDVKMYLNIKVKEAGYLKNGIVSFSSANFNVKTGFENEYIQEIKEDKIYLKQLDTNSNILIELPIIPKKGDIVSVDNFVQESKVRIDGTYVNAKGKEISIEKEHTVKLILNGEAKIVAEATINKYVPYKLGEEYGVILQYEIRTGLENNNLPIKTTELQLKVPTINDNTPNDIKVMANNTKATNGKEDGIDFTQANWNYNAETKLVNIKVENILENNNISWKKNCTDEYLVTFKYDGKEIYDYVNSTEKFNVSTDFTAKIEAYNNEETIKEQEFTGEAEITKKINEIVDFNIKATKEISKGHIYANFDAKEKVETSYTVKYTANIAYANLINEIEFIQEADNFKDETTEYSTVVSNKNGIYTTEISISENVFNKILGTDGYIDVFNPNQDKIGTINSQSLKDGLYTFDCKNLDLNKLTLKTSAPITEGTLNIFVKKSIKGESGYSKEEIKSFKEIKASVIGKTELAEQTKQEKVALKEPVSKAELTISKNNLSTITVNENVEIRATLDTSNINNSLYKNPTVKLVFPKYFEKVEISDAKLLFEDELKLKNNNWSTENGNKVLTLSFEGTQTKYNSEATTKGATISILADITLEKLTPSMKEKIKMYYTNENTNLYDNTENEMGITEANINLVAPTGVVAANGIKDYAEGEKVILSMSGDTQVGKIAVGAEEKIATINGLIINNNKNSISNVKILGRLPFKGNKQIDTETDLKSTFSATLQDKIQINANSETVKVYYSENSNATKDLENAENAWTLEMDNMENVKSYLIVLDTDLNTGDKVEFNYEVKIPADLPYNNASYTSYKVYYDNNEQTGTSAETKLSPVIGISTGEGPKLKVTLTSNMAEGSEVRERQIVRFTAIVENVGETTAENVELIIDAPENTTHVEYDVSTRSFIELSKKNKKVSLGNIAPGKTVKKIYELKMNNIEDSLENIEILNKVKASGTTSNEYKLLLKKAELEIETTTPIETQALLVKGDRVTFKTSIENVSEQDMSGVVWEMKIPEGMKVIEAGAQDKFIAVKPDDDKVEIEKDVVKIDLSNIGKNVIKYVTFELEVEEPMEEMIIISKVRANNVSEHYSNEIIFYGKKAELKIEQNIKEGQKQTVKEGENIEYIVTVENIGELDTTENIIEIKTPTETKLVETKYTYNGTEYIEDSTYDNVLSIYLRNIQAGKKVDINVKLVAKQLQEQQEKEVIIEPATIISATTNKIETKNKLKFYIQPSLENRKHKISGTAWLDANKNGQREETETLLPNMQVMLVYKETGELVKDLDTNIPKKVTTDENGKYEFLNLDKGEYLVVFVYDTEKYSVTEFNAEGIEASVNSDAIEIEMELDGKSQKVAVSDVLKIEDTDIRDIDIGLYITEKFDLRLDKYISKITLTTPTIGTQVYNKNNEKLSKVEVLNRNVGQSSFVVEYKIIVTNEGTAAGYVKKVVDYLPKEAKFNSELNKDWFLAKDGNAYNSILTDVKLEPGQSKEITLVLSYSITEELIGNIVNNNAEIYESYNEQGLQDIDSKAGNKISTEDDMSNADIAVSIVTGKIVGYTTLILAILAILVFGIYEIKKQVLDKKI